MKRYIINFEDVQRAEDETTDTTHYGGAVKATVDGTTARLPVSGNDRGGSVWESVQGQFEEKVLGRKLTAAEFDELEASGITAGQSGDVAL